MVPCVAVLTTPAPNRIPSGYYVENIFKKKQLAEPYGGIGSNCAAGEVRVSRRKA